MILNQQGLEALETVFNAAFQSAFTIADPMWDRIATRTGSTRASNLYAWLGQFPQVRKWLGQRTVNSIKSHNYTLINDDYESTIEVPRNDILDDEIGVYTPLVQEQGFAAAAFADELMANTLLAGDSSLCYDGQFMFDTDHPVLVDGSPTSVSNIDTSAGTVSTKWFLMDTRRPLKPLIYQVRQEFDFQSLTNPSDPNVFSQKKFLYGIDGRFAGGYGLWQLAYQSINDLDETNFDAAMAAMMSINSDEGRPLGVMPNLLVCGPSRRAEAKALIENDRLASGASNKNFQAVDLLVTPWLP